MAGSYLVKAAIGEDIDNETLGGATTHCEISGVTDYKSEDDKDCLNTIRSIMDKVGDFEKAGFNRIEAAAPKKDEKELYGIMPAEELSPTKQWTSLSAWQTTLSLKNTKLVSANPLYVAMPVLMAGRLVSLPISARL